jgi:hypothetical protein
MFKNRSFLSTGTFLFFVVLAVSGVGLHVLDHQSPTFVLVYFKTLHTIFAVGFLIFSIAHVWKNWKTFRSYIGKKAVSKEMIIVVVLTIIFLIISWFKAVSTANEHGIPF